MSRTGSSTGSGTERLENGGRHQKTVRVRVRHRKTGNPFALTESVPSMTTLESSPAVQICFLEQSAYQKTDVDRRDSPVVSPARRQVSGRNHRLSLLTAAADDRCRTETRDLLIPPFLTHPDLPPAFTVASPSLY